jgi:hypothetical protein
MKRHLADESLLSHLLHFGSALAMIHGCESWYPLLFQVAARHPGRVNLGLLKANTCLDGAEVVVNNS